SQKSILLNVNIPAKLDIQGIRICRQAEARWVEEFQEGTDPRGEKYYWLTGRFENHDEEETDTDVYALGQGYISVVPSKHDLTAYEEIIKVSELLS
ncbi:MAG: 5'/3'-nucleotidase SurE, partial [Saprospiraceae bacterium]|nr:5'/3'-nucleotidase SurE [Saprospiraceae bacterium]